MLFSRWMNEQFDGSGHESRSAVDYNQIKLVTPPSFFRRKGSTITICYWDKQKNKTRQRVLCWQRERIFGAQSWEAGRCRAEARPPPTSTGCLCYWCWPSCVQRFSGQSSEHRRRSNGLWVGRSLWFPCHHCRYLVISSFFALVACFCCVEDEVCDGGLVDVRQCATVCRFPVGAHTNCESSRSLPIFPRTRR